MSGWRAYVAVVAVFLFGAVAGAAGMHLVRVRVERQIAASPEPVVQATVLLLDRELSLTAQQETQIRDEIIGARRRFIEDHPTLLVDMKAVFEDAQERIGRTLTTEQRAVFERLVAERRALFDRTIAESQASAPSKP